MNKKNVEKFIPYALDAIKKEFGNGEDEISIKNEFNGYISSFGASIIQSGLAPTIAFYTNTKNRANQDRSKIINIIEEIIKKDKKYKINKNLLLTAIENDDREFINDVKDAAIALKLAIRTFKFEKEN
jgi:CRISPR-associated protein Cmr5